jgi:Protein of unknown function DUF262
MFRMRLFEAKTISWWYSQRGAIDTDPPYQRRGNIWSKDAKAYLVDSILNDFDIPKFYLADFSFANSPLNTNAMQYAIIDGKQRFEAIFDFYAGRVVLGEGFSFYDDPSLELSGLGFRDLARRYPQVASKFENYNLAVMSVITDDESKINELFLRLNSSRPLSAPEYRNAMQGIVPGLIRELAQHEFFRDRISFRTNRGEDQQVATKFLITEFRGELGDTKKTQLDSLVDEGAQAEAPRVEFERATARVTTVLDQMTEVFIHSDPLLRTQGPLVVYYWLVRTVGPEAGLREFMLNFERARQENREKAKIPERIKDLDLELLRYDSLSRSINDAGSLQGRARIILARYGRQNHQNRRFETS